MDDSIIDKKADEVTKAVLEIVPGSKVDRSIPWSLQHSVALTYPAITEDQINAICERCNLKRQEGVEWPMDGEYYVEFDARTEDDNTAILLICFSELYVAGNSNY